MAAEQPPSPNMETISVHVRVRPLNPQEREKNDVNAWQVEDNSIRQDSSIRQVNGDTRDASAAVYTLDNVFGPGCSTTEIYSRTAQPLLRHVLDGINGTILAYGQTSSGKTYTMHGNVATPGIIPLAIEEIFSMIETSNDRNYTVLVSYMELYNEEVNDLLNPALTKLEIRESMERGVHVDDLTQVEVCSASDVLELLRKGEANRRTAATRMNERSSRSHAVFRMEFINSQWNYEGEDVPVAEDGSCVPSETTKSVLTLVDLAGSERVAKTGAEGLRRKEGNAINLSLLTLGTVISKLSDPSTAAGHIPYRDSKLTRILQPSLGGNAKTAIICAMSPATDHLDESHQTLKFATRAKEVVNHATVNKVISQERLLKMKEVLIEELREEIQILKAQKCAGTDKEQQIEQELKDQEVKRLQVKLMQCEKDKAKLQAAMAEPKKGHQRFQSRPGRETWCPGDFLRADADPTAAVTYGGRKRQMESTGDQYKTGDALMRASQRARSVSEGPDSPTASQDVDGEISSRLPRKILEEQLKEAKEVIQTMKRDSETDEKDQPRRSEATGEEKLRAMQEEIDRCRAELAQERHTRTQLQYEVQMHQTNMEEMSTKVQLKDTELDAMRSVLEHMNRAQKSARSVDDMSEIDQDADLDSISVVAEPADFNIKLQAATEQAAEAEQRAQAAEHECQLLKEVLAQAELNMRKVQEDKEAALTEAASTIAHLQAEHTHNAEVVRNLAAKVSQLESENAELARKVEAGPVPGMTSARSFQGEAAAPAGVDVEDMKLRLDKAKELEDQLRGQLEELNNKVEMSEGEIRLLVRAKAEIECEVRQLRSGNDPYKNRYVDLSTVIKEKEDPKDSRLKTRQEIAALKAEVQKLQTESKTFTKLKDTLQKDLDGMRKRLLETDGKLKQAIHERTDAVQEKAALERKLKNYNVKASVIEKNLERKETMLDKKKGILSSEVSTMKAQVEAAEEQLQDTMASLQKAQEELTVKSSELEAARLEISELKSDLQDLTTTNKNLAAEVSKAKELEKQLADAESRIEAAEKHSDILNKGLRKTVEELSTLQHQHKTVCAQLQQEEDTVKDLSEAKDDLTSVIATLSLQLEDAQEQIQHMEQQMQAAEQDLKKTSADLSSASQRSRNAQPGAEEDTQQLLKQLQQTNNHLADLQLTYDQLVKTAQEEKMELEATIENLQTELQEVQASLAEKDEQIEVLRLRCASQGERLDSALNRNKIMSDEQQKQIKELDRCYEEVDTLRQQIQKLKGSGSQASTPSKTPPRTSIARGTTVIDRLTPDNLLQELTKQKEQHAQLVEEKTAEVESLQTELQAMSSTVSDAQAQVAGLKAELQQYKLLLSKTTGADPEKMPLEADADEMEFDDLHLAEILIHGVAQRSAAASPTTANRMAVAAADYASAVLRSKALQEQLEDANARNRELEEKVAVMSKMASEHTADMQQLKVLADMGAGAVGLKEEVAQLRQELQEAVSKKNSYERQLEVLQKEASSLADKASKEQAYYASEMMRVKAELDEVLAEKATLENQIKGLKEEVAHFALKEEDVAAEHAAQMELLLSDLAVEEEKVQSLEQQLKEEREKYEIHPDEVCANLEATVQQLLFAASPHSNKSTDMIRSMAMSDFLASTEIHSDQPKSARMSSTGSDSFRDGSTDGGSPLLGTKLPAFPQFPGGTDADAMKKRAALPTLHEVAEPSNTTGRPDPITTGDLHAPDMCLSPCDLNITPADARMLRTQLGAARTQVQQLAAALRAKVMENADLQQELVDVKAALEERDTRSKSCLPHISGPVSKLSPRDRSKSPRDRARSASPGRNGPPPAGPEPDQKRLAEMERKIAQQLDMLHAYANDKAALQAEKEQLTGQVSQLKEHLHAASGNKAVDNKPVSEDSFTLEDSRALLEAAHAEIDSLREHVKQLEADNAGIRQQVDQHASEVNIKFDDDDDEPTNSRAVTASQQAMIVNLRRQLAVASNEADRLRQQYEPEPHKNTSRTSPASNRSSPRPMMISPVLTSRTGLALAITPPSEKFSKVSRFGSPMRRAGRENVSPARGASAKTPVSPPMMKQLGSMAMNFSPLTRNQVNIEGKDAKQVSALQAGQTVMNAEVPATQKMMAYVVHEPDHAVNTRGLPSASAEPYHGEAVQDVVQLKSEVEKLQNEVQEKGTQIEKLQGELSQLASAKGRAEDECKRLQTLMGKDQSNLEEQVTARVMELSEEQAKLSANVIEKEVRITQLLKENEDLQASKEALTRKLQDLRTELNTMLQQSVAKCENYQQQVDQLEAEKKRAIEELKAVNMRDAELKRKLEAAEGHASTHINAVRAMEAQNAVYSKQLAELEQQVAESKAMVSRQKDTIRNQQGDIKGYEREVKHLQDELEKKDKQLKDDIDAYEAEATQLKEKLAVKDAKLKAVQEDLESIRLEQEKLESDAQNMQSRHFKETQRLQEQTETFKLEHAGVQQQFEVLKRKLEECSTKLAAATADRDKALAERNELQEQVQHAFKELAAVNERADTFEKEKNAMVKQLTTVQQELSAAYKQQHMDKSARSSLQQRCDELEGKISAMTEERYHLEVKVKEQVRLKRFCLDNSPDPASLSQELAAAKQEVAKLEQRVRGLEAAEAKWVNEQERLKQELIEAHHGARQQQQQQQSWPTPEEYEQLDQELQHINAERLRLEDQVSQLLREKDCFEAELEEARRVADRRVAYREQAQGGALAEENQQLREEVSDMRSKLHGVRKLVAAGENQVIELTQQLEESIQVSQKLSEENVKLVQEINQLAQEKQHYIQQAEAARTEAADVVQRVRQESGLVDIDALTSVQQREQDLLKKVKDQEIHIIRLEDELRGRLFAPTPVELDELKNCSPEQLCEMVISMQKKSDTAMSVMNKLREDLHKSGGDLTRFDNRVDTRTLEWKVDVGHRASLKYEALLKEYKNTFAQLTAKANRWKEEVRVLEHLRRKHERIIAKFGDAPDSRRSNVAWAEDNTRQSSMGESNGRHERERAKSRERQRSVADTSDRSRARSSDRERARSATRSPAYRR